MSLFKCVNLLPDLAGVLYESVTKPDLNEIYAVASVLINALTQQFPTFFLLAYCKMAFYVWHFHKKNLKSILNR